MKFGELHYRRGVIQYSISPYEVNAFAGFFSKGIPNLMRRFKEKFFIVAPPFVIAYTVLQWAGYENARTKRKAYHQEHQE
ncbi:unnamed protein product [Dibothriocephalus latus]|uniref:Cytochrome b-c1 complex subunit 8 n=1 Tax=Dibothriocephalus latus TaxID=60516 RepID=A0A3P6UGM9_DIBLA|nr:unnamed protein product [Dibothriocephalus latus]